MTRLDVHLDADLAVTLVDDRPGTLAKAIACVSRAGINIDGYAEIGGVAGRGRLVGDGEAAEVRGTRPERGLRDGQGRGSRDLRTRVESA